MKVLLVILLFVCEIVNAQFGNRNLFLRTSSTPPPSVGNTPFSFTQIPYNTSDSINYGRGAEQWHNGSDGIPNPLESVNLPSLDLYYRFEWARIEGATQGSYNWTYFDNLVKDAINAGQQFSFGIMPYYSDGGFVSYDGHSSSYPEYLHDLMQAEPLWYNRDTIGSAGVWMANWNSPHYLSRLRALHEAVNTHILTSSYTAVSGPHAGQSIDFADVIYCIDIRGFGNYGEWHSGEMFPFGAFPAGRQPTAATLKEIIDTHTEVFTNWPLVMMVAAYNGSGGAPYINIFHPYNDVGYYALTATNEWGDVGYRRDQVGGTDNYLHDLLEDNTTTYEGSATFGSMIVNKFKTSPGTGEPLPFAATSNQMVDLINQITLYGATSFGNGNWLGYPNASTRDIIRAAWKLSGYRLIITTGEAPTIITRTTPFTIKINWENVGTTPAYNNWEVVFELQDGGGTAVWTGASSKVLKLFRPDQGEVETSDNLTVPGSVGAGTYKLVLRVQDPTEYRSDMKLMVQGRNSDGSYTIFNSVTVN